MSPRALAILGIIFLLPVASILALAPFALSWKECQTPPVSPVVKFVFCDFGQYHGPYLNLMEDAISGTAGIGATLLLVSVLTKLRRSRMGLLNKKIATMVLGVLIAATIMTTILVAGLIRFPARCVSDLMDTAYCYAPFQSGFWTLDGELKWYTFET